MQRAVARGAQQRCGLRAPAQALGDPHPCPPPTHLERALPGQGMPGALRTEQPSSGHLDHSSLVESGHRVNEIIKIFYRVWLE
jgi:hypothetical protein